MRRRLATALVVAIVFGVAVAAILDTVRPERTETRRGGGAAAELRALSVRGTLIYTDPDCELHALSLPDLIPTSPPEGRPDCQISVSPDGKRIQSGGARWNRLGSSYALCDHARVGVFFPPNGRPQYAYRGCAPAWRALTDDPWTDVLTIARDGDILEVRPTCETQPPCERVVVPRAEVVKAVLEHPNAPPDASAHELRMIDVAWTSPSEVVALIPVSDRFGRTVATTIAAFRNGRLAWHRPHFGSFERLLVARAGDVTSLPVEPQVTERFRITPRGPADWSPDGRRLAAATETSVYILDFGSGRSVRLPLRTRDLAWR